MKTWSLVLIIIFSWGLQVRAASVTETADSTFYEKGLKDGIEAFYQTHWSRAESIFNKLQRQAPDDSRAYFFSSMIPFWRYYFGESRQSADLFLERSRTAIAVSLDQLKANPHDTTMVLMLSGLYGYQSLVAASESQYRTAIQSGMTGFTYTRQLLALDDKDPKALIGKGMFYYMMGSVPSQLRWMTNMAGLSGSKKQGFEILEQAAESDSYVSNDAKMMLAYLYEREDKYNKALDHLQELNERYPQNIIFQYNLARLLEKCNQPLKAKAAYRQVLVLNNDQLPTLKEKSKHRFQNL